jgi:hypothetical protein
MENYKVKYVITAQIQLPNENYPKLMTLSNDGKKFTLDKNILLFDTKNDALQKISEMYDNGVISGIFILEYVVKTTNNGKQNT